LPTQPLRTFWTIPNILSLYRIVIFPFVLYLIIQKQESLFAIFITISLVTDILDGLIARVFKCQTDIGAKLDSWADTGTYILAFLAIYLFKWSTIKPYAGILLLFVFLWVLSYVIVFAKFGGLLGLHTWFFKLTGYLQGAFIVSLFNWGFSEWLFFISIGVGILAQLEEIIIFFVMKQKRSNVKGLYWVLKNRGI
jgi:CDP-diacylglycerol--glycerol-3-phosphate 3-phosphatidyltransferase